MRNFFRTFSILFLLFAGSPALAQTNVYLKPSEALKLIFKDSEEVIKEDHPVTPEVAEKAKKLLNYDLPKLSYPFYIGRTSGHVDGYALIDDEVGKVEPITFVTRISPEGKVDQV